MPFALDHDRAAMRADIRQAADRAFIVRCENERLVETALEQRERRHAPGAFTRAASPDPLPAARKDAVLLQLEVLRIGIDARRQRRCAADVLVDLEIGRGHAANLVPDNSHGKNCVLQRRPKSSRGASDARVQNKNSGDHCDNLADENIPRVMHTEEYARHSDANGQRDERQR